eukprot:CAMPEP_0115015722 /NCGR_PEP_ID=MMETSP0216-20121206/26955_1 /TAXON_ID=223996 /ORGANISM="Protocruzia adherens, Strain Boccale" /LENGTH=191 /DNA_ID=CAMNT_0002385931 /DNA_START=165 /DNA_END=740 /DNA_ORIENTATION=+
MVVSISDNMNELERQNTHDFVRFEACLLKQIIDVSKSKQNLSCFDNTEEYEMGHELMASFSATKVPSMPLEEYMNRILHYADCSSVCYVVALIYIDRVIRNTPGMQLTAFNVHRLVLISIMLAAKFVDDYHYDNYQYSKVGGISLQELNSLEVLFLGALQFDLTVDDLTLAAYTQELAHHRGQDRDNSNPN